MQLVRMQQGGKQACGMSTQLLLLTAVQGACTC
jgi:hypothetical protein